MNENVTDVGKLIDMTIDDFNKFCEDKNLGHIKGLENLMTITYNHLTKIRNDLNAQIKAKLFKGIDEEKKLLSDVYEKMQSTEERVFRLREIKKEKELK